MTAGMILLVTMLNPHPGDETDVAPLTYVTAGGGTAATIVALVVAAGRGGAMWRTACLGAAAGTSFGLTATLIKATIAQGDVQRRARCAHHVADLRRDRVRAARAGARPVGAAHRTAARPRSPASR